MSMSTCCFFCFIFLLLWPSKNVIYSNNYRCLCAVDGSPGVQFQDDFSVQNRGEPGMGPSSPSSGSSQGWPPASSLKILDRMNHLSWLTQQDESQTFPDGSGPPMGRPAIGYLCPFPIGGKRGEILGVSLRE